MTATPTPRSLLGLYRAGGTLDVDHKGGDHFLFLPEPEVVPESCVATVLDSIASRHGCKLGGNALWHGHMTPFDRRWGDGLRCDLYCGARSPGRSSH